VDWNTSVILLVRTIPEGMDRFPRITFLGRNDDTVELRADMVFLPNAQMADAVVQPWLIAEAPVQAFAGNPKIHVTVEGQGAGTVAHER
jgi:hypothetical protein